ncbi:MAG: hypothetical protein GF329_18775 [Candidatus Lokiarchaeota archaeon]|nr:hypothetical protein [Candidatus Lokiarchaeota archaeon]
MAFRYDDLYTDEEIYYMTNINGTFQYHNITRTLEFTYSPEKATSFRGVDESDSNIFVKIIKFDWFINLFSYIILYD